MRCTRREDGCIRQGYEYWADEGGEHKGAYVGDRRPAREDYIDGSLSDLYRRVHALEAQKDPTPCALVTDAVAELQAVHRWGNDITHTQVGLVLATLREALERMEC
jgi:hypothetical protein